jgi:sugar lactone lactonase YvrE
MTFDAAGDLFVANVNGTTVVAYKHPLSNGMAASFTLSGMFDPAGMAFDAAGNLYVSSCAAVPPSPLYKFNTPVNASTTPSATDPGANTTVNCADGATLDPSGNFWVGDFNGNFLEFPVGSATFTTMAPSLTLTPGAPFSNGYDVKFGP